MPTPARCGLVVVARDKFRKCAGEFDSKRGAVGGRRKSNVGFDRKGGEWLLGMFGPPHEVSDFAHKPSCHGS